MIHMKTIVTKQKSFYKFLILLTYIFFTSNCYLNPVVNSIVSPEETKENNSGLVLFAGLSGGNNVATLQVTGILKNSSGVPIENANIYLGPIFSSSVKDTPVSTTATTNSAGIFLIKLIPGIVPISVTDASGNFLGGFTLTVTPTSATQETPSSSQFSVSSLAVYNINDSISLETAPVGFTILSTNPADGATGVPIAGNLTFSIDYVFSKPVNVSTLTASNVSFMLGASQAAKTVTVSGSGTNITLIFGGGNIYGNYSYLITPTTGVKDMEGNSLTEKQITITTGMPL